MIRPNTSHRLVVIAIAMTASLALAEFVSAQVPFEVLHEFGGGVEGRYPGGLIQGTDGNFYGTTQSTPSRMGAVFTMTADGTVRVLHEIVSAEGAAPFFPLIQAADGNFYGTAYNGGPANFGTVFQVTPDGAFTVMHAFTGGVADGKYPGAIMQAADGNFYGTTVLGGASGFGMIFRMTTAGVVTILHSFEGGAPDGAAPGGGALIQATDGNFYGTTFLGGLDDRGTVFKMTQQGTLVVLHAFAGGPTDGAYSVAALVEALGGNFYGTTLSGGSGGDGTIFEMSPAGALKVLHSFFRSSDGANPDAALIHATDGNFYGTTQRGGPGGGGTLFEMTPRGFLTVLHSFAGTPDGVGPHLIEAADEKLYGTTVTGGSMLGGIAFRLDPLLCRDTLSLSYSDGTLDLGFTLYTPVPAIWSVWLIGSHGVAPWFAAIPAVSPEVSFERSIPGVPAVGPLGVLTFLSTPAHAVACFDWKVVNAGGGAPTQLP